MLPPDPERREATDATRVIFIAGGGRSGSTLLGDAAGNLPGALSAGEIKLGFRRGLIEDGHCGCRLPVRECPIWEPALTRTFGRIPTRREAEELDLRLSRLVRTRRVPWWLLGAPSPEADELADILGRLISEVARVGGVGTVVDSSKYPAYGALLQRSPLLDVRVVHVVRDPRAVAYSWQRQFASHQVRGFEEEMERFSPVATSLTWLAACTSVQAVWRKDPRNPLIVRYEDLVSRPQRELRRVAEHAGLTPDVEFAGPDGLDLHTSHAVAGNPSRVSSGWVSLKADDEWQTRMSTAARNTVSFLTAPRRSRYGY